jgi:hypothetical protein
MKEIIRNWKQLHIKNKKKAICLRESNWKKKFIKFNLGKEGFDTNED